MADTRDPVGFIVSLDGRFFGPFATAGEAIDFQRSYQGHTYTGLLYHPVDREHFTGEPSGVPSPPAPVPLGPEGGVGGEGIGGKSDG